MSPVNRKREAMRALNYDLFEPEIIVPPPPATIGSKLRRHAARVSHQPEKEVAEYDGLPPMSELYRMFDSYNWTYFDGKLPFVRIEYSSRMHAAGSYSSHRKLIKIGVRYHKLFPQDLADTLKHEMIHILHMNHDRHFRAEAVRIGASLRARSHPSLMRPPRYVYRCPECQREYARQKRLVMASCGECSKGRYNPRYKLQLVRSRTRGDI